MLVAWLRRCEEYTSNLEHVHACHTTLQQRQEARMWFMSLEGAAGFAGFEKDLPEGAPEEPAV